MKTSKPLSGTGELRTSNAECGLPRVRSFDVQRSAFVVRCFLALLLALTVTLRAEPPLPPVFTNTLTHKTFVLQWDSETNIWYEVYTNTDLTTTNWGFYKRIPISDRTATCNVPDYKQCYFTVKKLGRNVSQQP